MTRPTDMPDLAWFKANPEANYLVRGPRAGEVDALARTLLPQGAEWDGGFQLPDHHRTCVVAMRVAPRRVVRFLAAAPDYGPYTSLCPFSLVPIALGARVAID